MDKFKKNFSSDVTNNMIKFKKNLSKSFRRKEKEKTTEDQSLISVKSTEFDIATDKKTKVSAKQPSDLGSIVGPSTSQSSSNISNIQAKDLSQLEVGEEFTNKSSSSINNQVISSQPNFLKPSTPESSKNSNYDDKSNQRKISESYSLDTSSSRIQKSKLSQTKISGPIVPEFSSIFQESKLCQTDVSGPFISEPSRSVIQESKLCQTEVIEPFTPNFFNSNNYETESCQNEVSEVSIKTSNSSRPNHRFNSCQAEGIGEFTSEASISGNDDDKSYQTKVSDQSPLESSKNRNYENDSLQEMKESSKPSQSKDKIVESPKSNKKPEQGKMCTKCYMILGIITLLVSISSMCFIKPYQTNNSTIYGNFEQGLHKIRSRFTKQDNNIWRIISSAIKPIMENNNPSQPAIILFFGIDSGTKTIECFVKEIGNIINGAFNATKLVIIQGNEFENIDPDKMKEIVDNRLREGFKSLSRVAILHNINQMPTESMMKLYSYCDQENAPYKDRVIILTVLALKKEVTDELTSLNVEKYLEHVWSDRFDRDKIYPLLNRVGNNIAIINPEPYEISQC